MTDPEVTEGGTNYVISIQVASELDGDVLKEFFTHSTLHLVARAGCTKHDNFVLVLRAKIPESANQAPISADAAGCLLTQLMGLGDNIRDTVIQSMITGMLLNQDDPRNN